MKISLISSTGGHLSQLLQLNKELSRQSKSQFEIEIITEKNAITDEMAYKFLLQQDRKNPFFFIIFFVNIIRSIFLVLRFRPNYVLSTGAGAVLPYLVIAKIFGSKIIYIESFAKVTSPTITGRIVYKFADYFFVQWPELQRYYPNSQYWGSLY